MERNRRRHSRCAALGATQNLKKNGCSLTQGMRSTERTEPTCCGRFGTSGQADKVCLQLLQTLGHARDQNNGCGTFIHNRRCHQDPLSMFAYGVGLLPHSCSQGIFPAVDQTWYADDAGAGGSSTLSSNSLQSSKKSDHITAITQSPRRVFLSSHAEPSGCDSGFQVVSLPWATAIWWFHW
jgi:hypothetical protein